MRSARLSILCLSQLPPSPPRFGAQARMHGLWSALARQHDLTSVALADADFDLDECRAAMGRYSQEVLLLPNPRGRDGAVKRALQLRSLASLHSFERHRVEVPALQQALDQLLRTRHFDVVNVEFPYLAYLRLRQSPPGTPPPAVVVDSHEIAHEMVRQFAASSTSLGRRMYAESQLAQAPPRGARGLPQRGRGRACSVADRDAYSGTFPPPGRRWCPTPRTSSTTGRARRPGAGRTDRALLRAALHPAERRRAPLVRPGGLAPHRPGAARRSAGRSSEGRAARGARHWPGRASRSLASSRTCGPIWPPRRRSWCRSGWAAAPG